MWETRHLRPFPHQTTTTETPRLQTWLAPHTTTTRPTSAKASADRPPHNLPRFALASVRRFKTSPHPLLKVPPIFVQACDFDSLLAHPSTILPASLLSLVSACDSTPPYRHARILTLSQNTVLRIGRKANKGPSRLPAWRVKNGSGRRPGLALRPQSKDPFLRRHAG